MKSIKEYIIDREAVKNVSSNGLLEGLFGGSKHQAPRDSKNFEDLKKGDTLYVSELYVDEDTGDIVAQQKEEPIIDVKTDDEEIIIIIGHYLSTPISRSSNGRKRKQQRIGLHLNREDIEADRNKGREYTEYDHGTYLKCAPFTDEELKELQ